MRAARFAVHLVRLAPMVAPFVLAASCSTSSNLADKGGECFLATDCAPGLVCVEQDNKSRVCSDDLSTVVGGAPPNGPGQDAAGGDARSDAAQKADAGRPDTGTDTGSVEDAEPPPMDAGDQ